MDNRFFNIIENNLNLSTQEPIVIAFSGGIDSSCLLELFKRKFKFLVVAHFNHGLRETASRDEEFAKNIAEKADFPFRTERLDVGAYAKKMHYSIEEAARKARYKFLYQVAREFNSKFIAVAHHADDQVETVFMHLFRGSGLSGLSGMQEASIIPEFDSTIKIIRPLLPFWQDEIEEYCKNHQISYVFDETNLDNHYARNRLRNELIPMLKKEYPGLKKRILSMADIVGKDEEFLQSITNEKWELVRYNQWNDHIQINKDIFESLPVAIQRRIIRKAVFELKPGLRDLSYKNIDSVIQFLSKNKPGEIDLQENLIALFSSEHIYFGLNSKKWLTAIYPQLINDMKIEVGRNKMIELTSNWLFSVERIEHYNLKSIQPENEFSTYLDGGKVQNTIVIRTKKPGDKFQPLGLEKGSMKVSDFFVNEKLISAARVNWPLVTTAAGKIIWIPGFRLDQNFRISDQTKDILKLSLIKKD